MEYTDSNLCKTDYWVSNFYYSMLNDCDIIIKPGSGLLFLTNKAFYEKLNSGFRYNKKKKLNLYLNSLVFCTARVKLISYWNSYGKGLATLNTLKPTDLLNSNFSFNTINLNFIRKERLYTKLKYSRSPAYDIVSGGSAALFAGLLGFLVSEKFGFELVDSGDFYYVFMYSVFISFSIRPILVTIKRDRSIMNIISPLNILIHLKTLLVLLFRYMKY
jgi:hypothetical protein